MIGKTITDTNLTAIFRVVKMHGEYAYGFNMIDNAKAVAVPLKDIIEIGPESPVIKKLCGCERSRLFTANLLLDHMNNEATFLGISERTAARHRRIYGIGK